MHSSKVNAKAPEAIILMRKTTSKYFRFAVMLLCLISFDKNEKFKARKLLAVKREH